jgi:hypothetical protein
MSQYSQKFSYKKKIAPGFPGAISCTLNLIEERDASDIEEKIICCDCT